MREMKILGLNLRDYTVKESLRLTEQFMDSGALRTIMYISTQDLVKITKEPEKLEWLESLDMILWQSADILKTANILNWNRQREIENNEYLFEFLKRLAKEKRTIYLIADSTDADYGLMAKLLIIQGNLNIRGLNTFEAGDGNLINGINDVAPDVIISMMPCEKQLEFVHENRKMINGKIWLGLQEGELGKPRHFTLSRIFQKYYNKVLRSRVNKYNQEKAD